MKVSELISLCRDTTQFRISDIGNIESDKAMELLYETISIDQLKEVFENCIVVCIYPYSRGVLNLEVTQ